MMRAAVSVVTQRCAPPTPPPPSCPPPIHPVLCVHPVSFFPHLSIWPPVDALREPNRVSGTKWLYRFVTMCVKGRKTKPTKRTGEKKKKMNEKKKKRPEVINSEHDSVLSAKFFLIAEDPPAHILFVHLASFHSFICVCVSRASMMQKPSFYYWQRVGESDIGGARVSDNNLT